ncbi:glycosyltransferase family 2 protein [Niallia sp. Krafla_26]|uniref:glycosyltransferase family 2 protein n=1 Tax=Niallia sp. Krafla_26 TaxID=3064703 RepID=UPI003D165D50
MSISVVIPTFNRAHLLPKAVNSVLEQTLEPLEIIIVDDLSTDNTREVVQSFNNDKIKYVVNKRTKGANGARNTGILLAKGDYIAFQDSDDIWLPTKLETQIKYIEDHPDVDMVFCSLKINNILDNISRVVPKRKVKSDEIKGLLERGNFISTQTILLKKKVAEGNLFDESLMRFQDWDFVIRVSKKHTIHHLNQVLALAEVQNDSISKKVNQIQALKMFFTKYKELETANLITKSLYHDILASENKENGKVLRSKINSSYSFCYQLVDRVFNRRNRL